MTLTHDYPSPLRGRRAALGVITVVELLVFLDISVVKVALPAIGADLNMSEAALAWVISAYLLTFGGFQLVGCQHAGRVCCDSPAGPDSTNR